jgi:outer membrane protein OmpA-like peptidoglycan-associated protein
VGLAARLAFSAVGGERLPDVTRAGFEQRLDADFSDVRVHTDADAAAAARALDASALSFQEHIAFASGAYNPNTPGGRRLLAHELTHVVQSRDPRARLAQGVSRPTDAAETEADNTVDDPRATQAAEIHAVPAAVVHRAPAEGVPETQSTHQVGYRPGERARSLAAHADVDRLGEYRFSLSNFAVNQAQLKPDHADFLGLLVSGFGLSREPPGAHVRMIEGYTDLVDTEAKNEPLRRMRADAVAQHLLNRLQVPPENIDVVRGAPPGSLLTDNSTPEGRSQNRSVTIELEPLRAPTDHVIPQHTSTKWSLTSHATIAAGAIGGFGAGLFKLTDLTNGESRQIYFVGAGLAGGLGAFRVKGAGDLIIPPLITGSYPSPTQFETTIPHTFADFEGRGVIDLLSGDIVVAGYQLGWAHFAHVDTTEDKGIWIGGFQAGGLGLTGAILEGQWIVPH